jgi:hypothetical protein
VGSRSSGTWLLAQASRSTASQYCCWLRWTKPMENGSSGAWLLARSTVQWRCCHLGRTKPVACTFCYCSRSCGSCLHGVLVSLAFQSEGSRSCSWEEHGAPGSCVCQ